MKFNSPHNIKMAAWVFSSTCFMLRATIMVAGFQGPAPPEQEEMKRDRAQNSRTNLPPRTKRTRKWNSVISHSSSCLLFTWIYIAFLLTNLCYSAQGILHHNRICYARIKQDFPNYCIVHTALCFKQNHEGMMALLSFSWTFLFTPLVC